VCVTRVRSGGKITTRLSATREEFHTPLKNSFGAVDTPVEGKQDINAPLPPAGAPVLD